MPNVTLAESINEFTGFSNLNSLDKNTKKNYTGTISSNINNFSSFKSNKNGYLLPKTLDISNSEMNNLNNNLQNFTVQNRESINNIINTNNSGTNSIPNNKNNLNLSNIQSQLLPISSNRNSNSQVNKIFYSNNTSKVESSQGMDKTQSIEKKILENISKYNTLGSSIANESQRDKNSIKTKKEILKSKKKILIIDDNYFIRSSLRNILIEIDRENQQNFEIIEGNDGVEILKEVIEHHRTDSTIDIVFTEEKMEYLDGSESIKIIRMLEKANRIRKTNFVSVAFFEDQDVNCLLSKVGADCIASKPNTKNQIFNLLNNFGVIEQQDV